MQFREFKQLQQKHMEEMFTDISTLFVVDVDKDTLWNTYLNSFPEGTNKVFRERREFDCSCCKSFIRAFGNVVAIKDNKIITIWDFQTNDTTYQTVCDALSQLVKSSVVSDVFVTKESGFGTDYNHEQLKDGTVVTWHHFRVDLSKKFVNNSYETDGTITGQLRDIRNVFQRSLEEITKDSIETVLDLIAQKSLQPRIVTGKHYEYHAIVR